MNALIKLFGASLLAALAFSATAASAASGGTAFSKIVVFGDSLNDTGNLFRLTQGQFPSVPNYFKGRQTNGPVWVEYLADDLGLEKKILNYAVVGALTKPIFLPAANEVTGNVWSDTFPGLENTDVYSQVLDYATDCHGRADPTALYILEGGINDLTRVADPSVIVVNLVASLVALDRIGARHILIVNLPDAGKTPRVLLGEMYGILPPGTAAIYSGVCDQLNQALTGAVAQAVSRGVRITFADTYGFLDQVVANPSAYDLTQVQLPWLMAGAGTDPDQWLFWDDLHPTTRGHEIFADQVLDELIQNYARCHGNGFGRDDFPHHRHERVKHGAPGRR